MLRTFAAAVTACFGLAACQSATYPPGSTDTFGDAVRHNMAAQIVTPKVADPQLETPADGSRAAVTIDRYRTDTVEPPATTSLSGVAGSSSQ